MKVKTLGQFIIERQADFPFAKGELSRLLRDIGIAAKIVNREVSKAGLVEILGDTGTVNIQGESVKKLDVFANDQFIAAFKAGGEVRAIASEENEHIITVGNTNSKYLVAIDPLDGSSNIDVNVSVGTIFSIYRCNTEQAEAQEFDFFQIGRHQIAAGYVIYGSSCMLVYTTGHGVNGFTLDPSIGEFCLSHPDLKTPEQGMVYSINEGNRLQFSSGIQNYINQCHARGFASRYIGSGVADIHRNLLKGGIFMYPATQKATQGKLRLLYECNPLAMIVEQAGGSATNGLVSILDIPIQSLHQRTPLFIGSKHMVQEAQQYLKQG